MRACLLALALCLTSLPLGAQELRDFTVSPAEIQPGNGERAQFTFTAPSDGQALLRLFGPDWLQVAEVPVDDIVADTPVTVSWDGTDREGNLLPDEAYFGVVDFSGNAGGALLLDPSDKTALGAVLVQNSRYEAQAGGVRFDLAVPARVTLLAGIDGGGPLMHTLLSGVPYPAGSHLLPWDGMDQSNVVDLVSDPNFRLFVSARELWSPSVILRNTGADPYHILSRQMLDDGMPTKDAPRIEDFGGAPHLLPKPEDISPEPVFTLSVTGHDPASGTVPQVSGEVPLTVSLGDKIRVPVLARRFEIVLFHNYEFTTEIEEGRSPATIVWDASTLSPGRYLLTVNVATLPGQMSAASVYVDLVQ